jgi:hypothetical protein
VAYRWIVRWVFGMLGWENSRPLPACLYNEIRPMKIDIMFLVHNFQKFGAGFFHFSLFFLFELLVNNFLDPVKKPIKI